MPQKSNSWMIYILKLSNGTYYTGITNNLERRLDQHSKGKGSKYVRANLPFTLKYLETSPNRSISSKREYEIKQMTRKQKEALIESPLNEKEQYESISNQTTF